MIVVLGKGATDEQIQEVRERLESAGYRSAVWRGVERTVIGAIGTIEEQVKDRLIEQLESLPFVESAIRILRPYKLVAREWKREPSEVTVNGKRIGSEYFVVMAGPCAVEGREQLLMTAKGVKEAGADILRGGAFKPRTSPHTFQGLGVEGLRILKEVSEETGLPVITELMDPRDLDAVLEVADIIQIGARNMQNFTLLKAVGGVKRPVLLKRGLSATIEEWLQAAEYICVGGNDQVILCERGIRTFETYTRNTLDLSAVVAAKKLSHLPVVVDPSHGTGKWDMVIPMSLAAAACGADGLLVEVHPDPSNAVSDGPQSLTLERFAELMRRIEPVVEAVGRKLYHRPSCHLTAGEKTQV